MTDLTRTLGCCYYPEHWPRSVWAEDARRMAETGLTWVRIGEFAWSRLEPRPGELQFEWLDEAIWTLGDAGLQVVLGTPTATPPRWMLERHPDMLAVDAEGRPRKFGSRRHYCFSHEGFAAESDRIVGLLADRYGRNEHIGAWQTDNEYGCHDTTISYSDAARTAFRRWLKDRYGEIDALNAAWGNVFWSMEYRDFDEIDLPNLTVTEPNPAHALAFRRFSSDQVVRFNRRQVEIIRARSKAPITHNYMGRITDFDHFAVGRDLDFASWDSYPLGFLEDRAGATPEQQRAYARQGDPDFQAFHHDLYRAVGRGRMWVMEQQPGPVNWAPHSPRRCRAWSGCGAGRPLPMAPNASATSVGGRPPSRRNSCIPGCCAPTASPRRGWRRRARSRKRSRRPPPSPMPAPRWRCCSTTMPTPLGRCSRMARG